MSKLHNLDNYKPKPNKNWQLHWLDDQPVLFAKSHDRLHLLNPVAGFIWTCCDGKTEVRAIRDALQDIFIDNQEEIVRDLPNILESWQENGLIHLDLLSYYLKTKPNNPYQLDEKGQQLQKDLRTNYNSSSYQYNITTCDTKKFMWFQVPKICTRTIYFHLKQNVHLNCEHALNIFYPINLYSDYFKFAFVRNPWDRLVSCWHNKVVQANYFSFNDDRYEKMQLFENFVDYVLSLDINTCDEHLRLQARLIDLNEIDYIGRFETFAEDYTAICQKLELPLDNIIHRNKSPKTKHYKEFYTDELREKVHQIYLKDIQIFGYEFY